LAEKDLFLTVASGVKEKGYYMLHYTIAPRAFCSHTSNSSM